MERILHQILEELKSHGQELKTINGRMDRLEEGQELLVERVGNLEHGQAELRAGQEAQGQELKAQGERIDNLQSDLTKLSIHVEGEITDKIRGLYDHRAVVNDSLKRIEKRLDNQDDRLDLKKR